MLSLPYLLLLLLLSMIILIIGLTSDHPFQVYYKVRQLILLQSAIAFLLQSATEHCTRNREITFNYKFSEIS